MPQVGAALVRIKQLDPGTDPDRQRRVRGCSLQSLIHLVARKTYFRYDDNRRNHRHAKKQITSQKMLTLHVYFTLNVIFVPKIHEYMYIYTHVHTAYIHTIYTTENLYLRPDTEKEWHVRFKVMRPQVPVSQWYFHMYQSVNGTFTHTSQ